MLLPDLLANVTACPPRKAGGGPTTAGVALASIQLVVAMTIAMTIASEDKAAGRLGEFMAQHILEHNRCRWQGNPDAVW
jgi:hypothetical protein